MTRDDEPGDAAGSVDAKPRRPASVPSTHSTPFIVPEPGGFQLQHARLTPSEAARPEQHHPSETGSASVPSIEDYRERRRQDSSRRFFAPLPRQPPPPSATRPPRLGLTSMSPSGAKPRPAIVSPGSKRSRGRTTPTSSTRAGLAMPSPRKVCFSPMPAAPTSRTRRKKIADGHRSQSRDLQAPEHIARPAQRR